MARKVRDLENSGWITNIFVIDDFVYFTDANFNSSYSSLYKISKINLIENLKNKGDFGRKFLANPLIEYSNDAILISQSDVEFVKKEDNYIQNFFKFREKIFISYLIDQKLYTQVFDENKERKNIQVLLNNTNGMVGKVGKEISLYDENLKKLKNYQIDILSCVEFENNFIVLKNNFEVWLCDKEFEDIECIDNTKEFKNIFYLNKNNVLISYKDSKSTIAINIKDKNKLQIIDNFLIRAVLLDDNNLLVKVMYDNNDNINMKSLLKLIY
ncbi:hypothetical protein [Spiroplasma tabanidicola]|nr:hypothetical protein [Spiroplasma tabanidicola]